MSGNSDRIEVDYDEIKIDDEKFSAILFAFGDQEVWLPRSLIEVDTDAETVWVPQWKAEQEGIV